MEFGARKPAGHAAPSGGTSPVWICGLFFNHLLGALGHIKVLSGSLLMVVWETGLTRQKALRDGQKLYF